LSPSKFYALVVVPLLPACVSPTPIKEINQKYSDLLEQRATQYRIKPGDTITVKFYAQDPELNQVWFVLPDGRTDPFFMNDAVVAGKTVRQLEEDVKRSYVDQVRDGELSMDIRPAEESVILEGQLVRPAVVPYQNRMTLLQAMGTTGGYRVTACLDQVILRRGQDVFRIDMSDYHDTPDDLYLLPNDHIVVERNLVILIRDYIEEYVYGFFPPVLRSLIAF
jgi:protein involved in polysaccharide export with SLBB domain